MVWTKTRTYTPTSTLDFSDWLFGTALPLGGWVEEGTVDQTDARYYFMKKTVTLASGGTQNHFLAFEHEYPVAQNDFIVYAWDGVAANASGLVLLGSDTSWFPARVEYGVCTMWQEDSSDAFLIYRDRRIFSFGLSSAGYLDNTMNNGNQAATRPYYSLTPVGEFGMGDCGDWNGDRSLIRGGGASVNQQSENIYENRAWMLMRQQTNSSESIVFWQDPSNTWKQKAFAQTTFGTVQVAQIGTDYYLDVGPYLLPAGDTEPVL